MTPAQCRAARGLIDWTRQLLAAATQVNVATIRDFEFGLLGLDPVIEAAIKSAFESAGVEFVKVAGEHSVRLRKGAE